MLSDGNTQAANCQSSLTMMSDMSVALWNIGAVPLTERIKLGKGKSPKYLLGGKQQFALGEHCLQ